MKSVGIHPHLVSIIGCCTKVKVMNSVMLIVEYCALGDLQNYLRAAWNHMISEPARYSNVTSGDSLCNNIVVNKLYDFNPEQAKVILQATDLLSFARQIAKGMVSTLVFKTISYVLIYNCV